MVFIPTDAVLVRLLNKSKQQTHALSIKRDYKIRKIVGGGQPQSQLTGTIYLNDECQCMSGIAMLLSGLPTRDMISAPGRRALLRQRLQSKQSAIA